MIFYGRRGLLYCCFFSVLAAFIFNGCSKEHYKTKADEEVYGLIDQKWTDDLGHKVNYKISDVQADPNDLRPEQLVDISGPLNIAGTVAMATANSRQYQAEKEALYLAALNLSLVRHNFAMKWFGTFDADYARDAGDESVGSGGTLGFSQLLADGAQISTNIAVDWMRFLTGDPRTSLGSVLSASVTQPLLRDSGRKVVQENLTQAERNLLYEIRSFNRYRQTFVVSVVTQYYRVLQSLDEVKNAHSNYASLVLAYDEAQMAAEAGRRTRLQADQTKQNMLSARDNVTQTEQGYKQSLDEFKLVLSVPTDNDIQLDPNELSVLASMDITAPDFSIDDSIQTALANRLDLAVTFDRVDDARRKTEVAADALRAGLDLVAGASAGSTPPTELQRLQFQNGNYSAGLELDLPLDRKSEQVAYRQAIITLTQRQRDYQQAVDEVKLDVRSAYRKLAEAATRYQIQKNSLQLAMERVESTRMLIKAGRAVSRDLLEAQSSLLSAQNDTTSTLIDYTIAKLNFYRDIGVLKVRPDGLWEQQNDS